MAVEIPVVVDIMGGINKAAKDIPKAMKVLESGLSENALNLEVQLDSKGAKATVRDFVDGSITEIKTFRKAIGQLKNEIQNLTLEGNFDPNSGMGAALQEALVYLNKMKKGAEDMSNEAIRSAQNQDRLNKKLAEEQAHLESIRNTIYGIEEEIDFAQDQLKSTDITSEGFEKAAEKLRMVSKEMDDVQHKLLELGMETGSLDALNLKLSDLEKQWRAMGSQDMFDPSGKLTEGAEKIRSEYTEVAAQIRKQNDLLQEGVKKQQEAEAAARKASEEEERKANALIREQELFNKYRAGVVANANSMSRLNAELQEWKQILDNADIGTEKWSQAAGAVAQLSQKIREVNQEIANLGVKSRSIDGLNARIQAINEQWKKMGVYEKYLEIDFKQLTPEAKALYEEYKNHILALQQHGKTLDQILQKEQRRTKLVEQGAQRRKYENAILNSTVKTMRVLQEQERILSERLSRAQIGGGKYEQLKRQLESVRAELGQINGTPFESVAKSADHAGRSISSLLANAVKLYALHSAARFVRNIREVTAEFELQKVALGSIIRDTERAEGIFRQIKAAAIQSPFEIKDLVSYTKQLSAYQIETDKLFDTTMKLADVSAGLGVDMSRLVLAFGQVRAAAVLRGQELRQFTEAGIPLVDKLAEKFRELGREGTTTADVFQLISERAVPFRMIEEIFDDMTSAGGMFYKMQEKQAKTLAGQWANLKDSLSIMYDEIGRTDVVHGAMEKLIQDVRWLAQNWRVWAEAIKSAGTAMLVYVGYQKLSAAITAVLAKIETAATAAESAREKGMRRLITSIVGKTAVEKISTKSTSLASYATFRAAFATNTLSKAFWQLTMAMLSNPFGIIAVALTGLITLFTSLSRKARDVGSDIDAANASIESLNKTKGETSELIREYEELSKKQSLTAEESKKLKDITEQLADAYPRASKGIDENTNSLSLNLNKLKEYNAEARKASEKALGAQIRIDKREIKRNEREINKLTRSINRGTQGFGAIGGVLGFLTPLTDKQMAEMNAKIVKMATDNSQYAASIREIEAALAGLNKETDDAVKDTTLWQDKLIEFNSRVDENNNAIQILSPDQIKGYSTLDAALEDIAKQYKEQTEQVKILEEALKGKNAEEAKELMLSLSLARARKDLTKEILEYYNAMFLTEKKNGSHQAYQKDAFITMMENRMKFMKDFKSGYDNLSKYMTAEGALAEQSKIMLGRGQSLNIGAAEQKRAAEELSRWYQEQIDKVVKEMGAKGLKGTSVTEMLSHQIVGDTNRAKMLRDYQSLLQSLWDAKTDFDTSQAQKNIENAIKKLTEDIKRSETARDFYRNILDLTGDEELAENLSISVYGGVGKDFKERIQEQLYRALKEIEPDKIDNDLMNQILGDITVLDVDDIQKNLNKLPPKVKEMFQQIFEENQKYDADWLVDFEKTYAKAMTYSERVNRLESQRNEKIRDAQSMGKSPADTARITEYYNRKIAEVQLEAMKDTYTWTKAFEDLDGVSTQTLNNLISLIDEYITKYGKDLEPQQLKELTRQKEQAKQQLVSRNAYMATGKAIKDLLGASKRYSDLMKDGNENTEDGVRAADDMTDAIKRLVEAYNEIMDEMSQYASSAKDLMNIFASDSDASYFSEQLDGLTKTLSGIGRAGIGIAQIATGNVTPQAILQTITGIADVITGIFGGAQRARLRRINEQIEYQQDLLDDLSYSYNRLEKAIANAFGSDYIYNYNKQLENLVARQKAYEEQARLEREKGKKSDEEKIKEYENAARDTADEILDMQSQLSEFFAGTDLTSAAKDFATSWIDAYKEFGSTTDAMKERFQDLIESMVTQSLGAKIMQSILQPLFDEIDQMAATGGELTAGEIAKIATDAPMYIGQINDAMTNLMNQLGAAGYNLRQGVSGFTGISRDIAGASEESITGLAAGINTQNFYMSLISQNVAAILTAMTGETVEGATGAAVPDPYKEQVLTYMGSLPQMRDDMYAIRTLLERVIKPLGTNATHYVATRM